MKEILFYTSAFVVAVIIIVSIFAIATNLTDRPTSPTWEITLIQPEYNIVMIYMDHDTTGYRDMLPGATVKFERVVQ